MGWSSVNLHNGADIRGVNDVLPTIDEYDRFYHLRSHDVDYDDATYEDMHEDAITLNDDIALDNVRWGDDDNVNVAFEVPFMTKVIFLLHRWGLGWVVFSFHLLLRIVVGIILFVMKVTHK